MCPRRPAVPRTRYACLFPHTNLAPPCSSHVPGLSVAQDPAATHALVTGTRQNSSPEIESDDGFERRPAVLHTDRRGSGEEYEHALQRRAWRLASDVTREAVLATLYWAGEPRNSVPRLSSSSESRNGVVVSPANNTMTTRL